MQPQKKEEGCQVAEFETSSVKKPGRKRQRRVNNGNDSKIHLAREKKMCRAECPKRKKESEVITIRSRRRIYVMRMQQGD